MISAEIFLLRGLRLFFVFFGFPSSISQNDRLTTDLFVGVNNNDPEDPVRFICFGLSDSAVLFDTQYGGTELSKHVRDILDVSIILLIFLTFIKKKLYVYVMYIDVHLLYKKSTSLTLVLCSFRLTLIVFLSGSGPETDSQIDSER